MPIVVGLLVGGVIVLLTLGSAFVWLFSPVPHPDAPPARDPLPSPPPQSPHETQTKPMLRMGDGRLANYLVAPVEEAIAQSPCQHREDLPEFPLLSPTVATRVCNPLLIWRRPNSDSCTVTVRRLPGREIATKVSGIGGAQQLLPLPSGDFAVEVRSSGGDAVFCRGTFLVQPGSVYVEDEIDDLRLLVEARAELECDDPNPGDALQWLERLSWKGAQSGPALRLKLRALGLLGYEAEWRETCEQLRARSGDSTS